MEYFFVYLLRCNDGSYYVGHTDNLEKRVLEHESGLYSGYTSIRLPIELVFVQECGTRDEAFELERRIKKWTRRKKEALIEGNFDKLKLLSKKEF